MNMLNSISAVGFVGWLADFYLLATLLMLVAVLARWIRQPARRLTVDRIVAVELLALAVICALPFWPRISLIRAPLHAAIAESPKIAAPGPMPSLPARLPPLIRPPTPFHLSTKLETPEPAPPPASPEPRWSWVELVAVAYIACAALVILWLAWGAMMAARACRRAENAPEPLREELARIVGDGYRVPRLLASSRITTAVALGLRCPTILLPAGLVKEGSPQSIRAVLMHEWAHIRNGDLWLLALGRCLLVPLFAHPLFWWLRRAIRGDQELLADAAAAGDDRHAYAEELLRLARTRAFPSIGASMSVGIWESSSQFSRRIAMLLDERFHIEPRSSRSWRYQALGMLILLAAAGSLVTLRPGRSVGQVATPVGPLAPAANGAPVLGEKTAPQAPSAAADGEPSIYLPVFDGLWQASRRKAMEIELSAEQWKSLRAIANEWDRKNRSLADNRQSPTPQEVNDLRKRVAAVLTPRQLQSYSDLTLGSEAFRIMSSEGNRKAYGITISREQKEKLDQIYGNVSRVTSQRIERDVSAALAVLSPQQLEQLRPVVEERNLANDELSWSLVWQNKVVLNLSVVQGNSNGGLTLAAVPPDAKYANTVHEEFDLRQPTIADKLNLSADQRKQFSEIDAEHERETKQLIEEVTKLSSGERKRPEVVGVKAAGMRDATRRRIHALLSSEQWAMLKQSEFRNLAFGILREMIFPDAAFAVVVGARKTPIVLLGNPSFPKPLALVIPGSQQTPIVLNDQQKATLRRIYQEQEIQVGRIYQQTGRKAYDLLTPKQQEALRTDIAKKELSGMFEPLSDAALPTVSPPAGPEPADKGDSLSVNTITLGALNLTGTGPPASKDARPSSEKTWTTGYLASTEEMDPLLPVHSSLGIPAQRKDLGIEFRPEQWKKLHEISADWARDFRKRSEDTPQTTDKKEFAKFQAKWHDVVEAYRKRVDAVLTPEQLTAYWKGTLPAYAPMLAESETGNTIGITREQHDELRQFTREFFQQTHQAVERSGARLWAMLSPQQREILRSEVEKSIHTPEEWSVWYSRNYVASDAVVFVTLPLYTSLSDQAIADQLGETADQRRHLKEIDAEHRRETEKSIAEMQKLSPAEQKQFEFEEKAVRRLAETQRRMKAVLTPQQFTALKEVNFRYTVGYLFQNPTVQKTTELTNEQKDAWRRLVGDVADESNRAVREQERKSLDVLTPEQLKKFREYMEHHGL